MKNLEACHFIDKQAKQARLFRFPCINCGVVWGTISGVPIWDSDINIYTYIYVRM